MTPSGALAGAAASEATAFAEGLTAGSAGGALAEGFDGKCLEGYFSVPTSPSVKKMTRAPKERNSSVLTVAFGTKLLLLAADEDGSSPAGSSSLL